MPMCVYICARMPKCVCVSVCVCVCVCVFYGILCVQLYVHSLVHMPALCCVYLKISE